MEFFFIEPNIPTSNMFWKLECASDDEYTVDDHFDTIDNVSSRNTSQDSGQSIRSILEDSYTQPGKQPILTGQNRERDSNNNANTSTEDSRAAADTLMELIAKNLRRLQNKM